MLLQVISWWEIAFCGGSESEERGSGDVFDIVADLVTEFDPAAVWLYGSVARNDDDGDSDIDLLVVLDTYEPRDAINLKTRAFKGSTSSAPFDVSFSDPDRYVGRSQIPGTVERATVLDGRCVYRRD